MDNQITGGLTNEAWIAIIVVLVVALLGIIGLVVYCFYKNKSVDKNIVYQHNPKTREWIETQSSRGNVRPQMRTNPRSEIPVSTPPSQVMVPVNRTQQLERLPIDAQISKTTFSNNTEEYGVVIKDIGKSTANGQPNPAKNTQYIQQNMITESPTIYGTGGANKQILNQTQPVQYTTSQPMVYQQQGKEVLLQPQATIVQALPPTFQGSNQYLQPVIKMPAQKSVEPVHYQGATSTTAPQAVNYRSMTLTQNAGQISYQPVAVPVSNQSAYQPQPQSNFQPGNGPNPSRFFDPRMTARINNNHGPVSTIQVLQRQ